MPALVVLSHVPSDSGITTAPAANQTTQSFIPAVVFLIGSLLQHSHIFWPCLRVAGTEPGRTLHYFWRHLDF